MSKFIAKWFSGRWPVAFFLLFTVLLVRGDLSAQVPQQYQSALITANVTIAVFAVNFSFLAYQFAPYRALYRRISWRQLLAAVALFLVAFFPLLILSGALGTHLPVDRVALGTLPLVAMGGVLMLGLPSREADPEALLKRACSDKLLDVFIRAAAADASKQIKEHKSQALSDAAATPMHELFERRIPIVTEDDPFEFAVSLALLAIANADPPTFRRVVETLLTSLDKASRLDQQSFDHQARSAVRAHVSSALTRVGHESTERDRSGTLAEVFIATCVKRLRKDAIDKTQDGESSRIVRDAMVSVAARLVRKTTAPGALSAITCARETAEYALQDESASEDVMFWSAMTHHIGSIKALGHEAISVGNTDLLYRCLDALAWVGCSAVKKDRFLFGRECARALVQLGREARAKKLSCFWSKCLLDPADHVQERLGWLASWTAGLDEPKHNKWVDALSEAYSVFFGVECAFGFDATTRRPTTTQSSAPYRITVDNKGIVRTIDYSDVATTKEFWLG